MGGDQAPAVEVEAAVLAAREWGFPIVLVGDSERVRAELDKHDTDGLNLTIQHASQVVGMLDSASDAVRKKKDSSIRVAFNLVKEGRTQAVVSAGNSGATMAAGMFVLKRVRGIDRPAIATLLPNLRGKTLILDVGGNVDCKAHHLAQFAAMGDVYSRHIMGKTNPRVGLLSNGAEEKKGTELTRETHLLLKKSKFNYIGYVEGRDIFKGTVDVVVCDGFVGNVVLKVSEGIAEAMTTMLRAEIGSRLLAKIGYLLARTAFKAFKKKVDYAEVGGAPLLGIEGVGMICHGGSSPIAVKNAIRMGHEFASQDINRKLVGHLEKIGDAPAPDEEGGDSTENRALAGEPRS